MPKTNRVNIYIDGFNAYHRLLDFKNKNNRDYRWLNYKKLLESLMISNEQINKIYFFTAKKDSGIDTSSTERHKTYMAALEAVDIRVVEGNIKKMSFTCKSSICKLDNDSPARKYKIRTEKETDVNIAIHMLTDAFNNNFDTCFLISADSDFIPLLRKLKECFSNKRIGLMGFDGSRRVDKMIAETNKNKKGDEFFIRIKCDDFIGKSFPEIIKTKDSANIVKPEEYSIF